MKKHIHDTAKKLISWLMILAFWSVMPGCALSSGNTGSKPQIDLFSSSVGYLGPEGTYTQEAVERFFGKGGAHLPYASVEDAVSALSGGECSYAVIPQENTIGGAVIDYADTLINHREVSVAGEVVLPIDQNLLVLPGTGLEDIKTVYSHKQGIAQGKEWLEKNLPNAEVTEVSSTAEGAKMVSEGGDKSCAAIASAACAEVYGLEVRAAAIQNNDSNKTRFYVLSLDPPNTEGTGNIAFTAGGSAEGLPKLMSDIASSGMTLVTIHDRPMKTKLGEYTYIIECSGGSFQKYEKLTKNSFEFRFLGVFDVV